MERLVKNKKNEKIDKLIKEKSIFYYLFTALSCVVCSASHLLGFLSPINVAIIALSKNKYAICGFIASGFTYLVTDNFLSGLAYLCAMAIIIAYKSFKDEDESEVMLALISCSVIIILGLAIDYLVGKSGSELVFRISSAIICAVTIYFTSNVKNNAESLRILAVSEKSYASLGIVFVLLIATLSSINILVFNVGRVIAITLVLLAATKYRIYGGVIMGALTSCGVMLCSSQLAINTVLLSTAGMLCGVVTMMGGFFVAIVFMIVNIVGLITIGINVDTTNMLSDALLASVIYLAIPDRIINKMTQLVGMANSCDYGLSNAASRIDFTSKAISEVKMQLKKITNIVDSKIKNPDYSEMVCQNVCNLCPDNYKCWSLNYERTNKAFGHISEKLTMNGKVGVDYLPELSWCTFKSTILNEFSSVYNKSKYDQVLCNKNQNAKDVVIDQLSIMESMLNDISEDITMDYVPQRYKTLQLNKYLSKELQDNFRACVYNDNDNNVYVEIYIPESYKFDEIKLCNDISDICECELEMPTSVKIKNQIKITLSEKMPLEISQEVCQTTSSKSDFSGDSYEVVDISSVEKAIILSDGMGTGKQAKIDSMMAVNFASRLLRSGFKPSTIVRMINSMLSIKGWDESFATLDIAHINLKKQRVEIIKAGAFQSFIIRGKEIIRISQTTLPLGIISEDVPDAKRYYVKNGDILIMMTDGVLAALENRIVEFIIKNPDLSVKEINTKIMDIISANKCQNFDDITVIVSKFNN